MLCSPLAGNKQRFVVIALEAGVSRGRALIVALSSSRRKGVQKANAKHEPQAFRDQLVKHLESVPPGDFDAIASKLDALGNQVRSSLVCSGLSGGS